jgi:sorbitol-specific phosphotransferase system component IIC
MVPDARVFSSMQNEQKYPWLYDNVVHQGYLCKFLLTVFGHSSSSQEFVTVGINLGTV